MMLIKDLKYVLENVDELRARFQAAEDVFGDHPDWLEAPWSVILIDFHPEPPTEEEIAWAKDLEENLRRTDLTFARIMKDKKR